MKFSFFHSEIWYHRAAFSWKSVSGSGKILNGGHLCFTSNSLIRELEVTYIP